MTARRAGRPLWWVAGLVLVLVAAGVGLALASAPESAVLPPEPVDRTEGATSRENAAAELLLELENGLEQRSRADVVGLAAAGVRPAARELAAMVSNVRRLGITDLSLRYLDENTGRKVVEVPRRLADRAWVGDVQLAWRIGRYERATSRLDVTMTFVETPDGVAFATARGDYGVQTPLWLLDRLAVVKTPRALVMVAGRPAEARRFSLLADAAVRDVRKVLPDWRGRLVVEVPGSQDDLDRVLTTESSYDAIAAVTAPVDGSLEATAPTHVFVNPPVFSPLGRIGSQIVMTHEAAHVATDAAISTMPTWLLEGFADYVALAHVDLPVEVTASQILDEVEASGPPRRLPSEKDFKSENKALGSSYEAAWLVCRVIAQEFGERKLIAFYERADADDSADAAFREVLGTTERRVTSLWRNELSRLAG
jgi:hypothetical protein